MIITIELQSPEEMAWLQPLLVELQHRSVQVKIQQPPLQAGSFDLEALLNAVQEAGKLGVFAEIQDPVTWQKQIRDEWEG